VQTCRRKTRYPPAILAAESGQTIDHRLAGFRPPHLGAAAELFRMGFANNNFLVTILLMPVDHTSLES
jgi:hypothetical protein